MFGYLAGRHVNMNYARLPVLCFEVILAAIASGAPLRIALRLINKVKVTASLPVRETSEECLFPNQDRGTDSEFLALQKFGVCPPIFFSILISKSGSTGLVRWSLNPAALLRARSSGWP